MKTEWLKRDNSERLLIYFNGWGMDSAPFRRLEAEGLDVVCHYDYSSISPEELDYLPELAAYDEVYLAAWSYGVWVAGQLYQHFPKGKIKSVAINGTLKPIDDSCGIYQDIFQATLAGLSGEEQTAKAIRERFYYNMFGARNEYKRFLEEAPRREIGEQRDELEHLSKKIFASPEKSDISFDKVIISSRDKIIFTRNQLRFWQEEGAQIVELDEAHFPFYRWQSWNELLREVFKVG